MNGNMASCPICAISEIPAPRHRHLLSAHSHSTFTPHSLLSTAPTWFRLSTLLFLSFSHSLFLTQAQSPSPTSFPPPPPLPPNTHTYSLTTSPFLPAYNSTPHSSNSSDEGRRGQPKQPERARMRLRRRICQVRPGTAAEPGNLNSEWLEVRRPPPALTRAVGAEFAARSEK